MIERLVVFGGTGDLMGRYLLPGLAALRAGGHLPAGFELVGSARHELDDERYRAWAADWLEREAAEVDAEARAALVRAARYRRVDFGDPASVAAAIAGDGPVAVYLALPPAVFPTAVSALHGAGLPPDSQVVLEKPFGEDLDSAVALNRLLAEQFDERHVFRVDHFLAMTTVRNVLGTRLANRVLEPIWTCAHIEEIEIVWDETLALEGRAGYYDGVGALKDMVQNHLLQLLCLVAMEPPVSLGERDLRDRKVDVLRSVRPLRADELASRTRRARYRGYADEEGVAPERGTETFAEVVLELDSWRWSGTRFRLRTGKALATDRKEIVVHFRAVPHDPFAAPEAPAPNVLRFGLEPENLSLELTGTGPGAKLSLVPVVMTAELGPPELPAYGRVLLDVLSGDATLSIRGDEAEESWRIVAPVLEGWSSDAVPLDEYDPRSTDRSGGWRERTPDAVTAPRVVAWPLEPGQLSEGPRWDEERQELLWVDILGRGFHRATLTADGGPDRVRSIALDRHVGAVAPVAGGGYVLAAGQGFLFVDDAGSVRELAQPEAGHDHVRMNDGACDPQGRFWAGTMAYDESPGAGTLYRLELDGRCSTVLTGMTISNGIGWSPDGATMYLSDSGTGLVEAFDFDGDTGAIGGRRTLVQVDRPGAAPDGLTVDQEGDIWVGLYGGWAVERYRPDGSLRGTVDIPAAQATSCAFGGPDLRTLFVTTGRERLDEAALERQPDAGRVFAVTGVDARGAGCSAYLGRFAAASAG